jgi:tRNA (cytidine/uridine-2'-O-)-methyltransferase
MFNIVLVEPMIPQNTGTIGRLCVNLGASLHLIKPLGFDISDKAVKRAGLDYWSKLDLTVWNNFNEFLKVHPIDNNSHLATTKTDNLYFNSSFSKGDYIIFGSESKGINEAILKANKNRCITIPMTNGGRSLNLSISVGIITYEALKQNYDGFKKITINMKN